MSESEVTQNNSEEELQRPGGKGVNEKEDVYSGENHRDVREDAKFFPHLGGGQRGSGDDGDLTDAMAFLNQIKVEYKDSIPVYDNFLETMRDFKFGKIDENEVCKAVRILFKDKPFLIRHFDEYLPQYLRYGDNRGYEPPAPKYPGYHHPRSGGGAYMGPPPPMPPRMSHPQGVMPPPPSQPRYVGRKTVQRGSEPETPKHRLAEDFIHLVKKRYINNPGVYKQFVELLQRPRNSFGRLLTDVSALFSDSPDLIDLFERNFKPGGGDGSDGQMDPLRAIKDSLSEKNVHEDFLKLLNFYNQNCISASDLIFLVTPLIRDEEKIKAFRSFIKYESKEKNNTDVRDYERIGSYRIFPSPQFFSTDADIQKDVLNNLCISVSTYESEEDTYVFRNKNSSEELLVRVCDERVESDLVLSRLRYLISELEDIYTRISSSNDSNNGWLELEDIHMSTPLVKETLKQIYESKGVEVLELILTNPAKAVPVVLRRLYTVYRENLASHRNHRRSWRALVEEHYYKAYDTKGVSFKNSERKSLTLRHIYGSSKTPFSLSVTNQDTISLVRRLFALFVSSAPPAVQNRVSNEDQIASFDSVLSLLVSDGDTRQVVSFEDYALALYIATLYDRFYHLRNLPSEPLTSSPVAVKLGLQEEFRIIDRYAALVTASESLASRDIDPEQYEERVRFLTEAAGYKLYNLRRILSKMERLVLQKITQSNEENVGFDGQFVISKQDGVLTLCAVEDDE